MKKTKSIRESLEFDSHNQQITIGGSMKELVTYIHNQSETDPTQISYVLAKTDMEKIKDIRTRIKKVKPLGLNDEIKRTLMPTKITLLPKCVALPTLDPSEKCVMFYFGVDYTYYLLGEKQEEYIEFVFDNSKIEVRKHVYEITDTSANSNFLAGLYLLKYLTNEFGHLLYRKFNLGVVKRNEYPFVIYYGSIGNYKYFDSPSKYSESSELNTPVLYDSNKVEGHTTGEEDSFVIFTETY